MKKSLTYILFAILLLLIMVLCVMPLTAVAVDLPIITGNSAYRSSATAATVKLMSDTDGVAYYVITDSETAPSAAVLAAWTNAGEVTAGVTKNIVLSGLTAGAKYAHIVLNGADGVSNVLTITMPQDCYYYEDFEAYSENTYVAQSGSPFAPIIQQYNGTGNANQKVASASGNNYFSLTSAGSWASEQRINLPSNYREGAERLVLKGKLMPLSDGPSWHEAALFGIGGRNIGVLFINGKICYADKSDINDISYNFKQWYEIELDISLTTNKYDIKVDGTTIATDVTYDDLEGYVTMFAGHSTTAYFDDITFYTLNGNPSQSIEHKIVNVSDTLYNGNEQKQTIIIDGLIEGTDFDVTYSADCTNVGVVTVTVTGKGSYFGTLTVTYNITRADKTAPVAPVAQNIGKNSITLTAVDGCEYSKDGAAWQESPVFDGLSISSSYTFYQRYKETANYKASPTSDGVTFTTDYGNVTTEMYSVPSANSYGWYNDNIIVSAKIGYCISKIAADFGSSILIDTETDNGFQDIFVRDLDGLIYKTTFTYKLDKTAPVDTQIRYNDNGFKSFLNSNVFGLFFNESVNVYARATDALSGIDAVKYFIADGEIADVASVAEWQSSLVIAPNSKKIVYVRFTDKAGNVTVCKDQGVAVYSNSEVSPKISSFDKNDSTQVDIVFTLTLNDNTLNAIKNGTITLTSGVDYSVSGSDVWVKKGYFAQFNEDDSVTLSFCFNPMGVETDAVAIEETATVSIIDTTHVHNGILVEMIHATAETTGTREHYRCDCDKLFGDAACSVEITTADIIIPKLAPAIIEGAEGKVQKGSDKELTFRSSAAFDDFVSVSVDGTVIDEAKYIKTSGSTVVTLKADYLATLSVGEHELSINSTTGSAAAGFTVEGGNGNLFIWIAALLAVGTAIAITVVFVIKKRSAR